MICVGGAIAGAIMGGVDYLLNPTLPGSDAQKYLGIDSFYEEMFFGVIAGTFCALLIFLPVFFFITRNKTVSLYRLGVSSGVFVVLLFFITAIFLAVSIDATSAVASIGMIVAWFLLALFLNLFLFRKDLLHKDIQS